MGAARFLLYIRCLYIRSAPIGRTSLRFPSRRPLGSLPSAPSGRFMRGPAVMRCSPRSFIRCGSAGAPFGQFLRVRTHLLMRTAHVHIGDARRWSCARSCTNSLARSRALRVGPDLPILLEPASLITRVAPAGSRCQARCAPQLILNRRCERSARDWASRRATDTLHEESGACAH